MTIARTIIVLAAILPALLAGADDLAVNGNPYTPIVTRNVFGLLPIPAVDPNASGPETPPPPKITPNGIMTIFGSKEALFKVAAVGKPGQPPQDQSYELGEGESQDDIEVVKIDDQADVITFNNHGTIQELPLSAAPDLSTPAAPTAGSGIPVPTPGFRRFPRPGMPAGGPNFARHLQSAQNQNNNGTDGSQNGAATAASPVDPFATPAPGDQLSPEAEALLIEKNYLDAKQNNDPSGPIYPPTELRSQSDEYLNGNSPDGPGATAPGNGPPTLPNP